MESTRTHRLKEWRRLGYILPELEEPEIWAGRQAEKFLNEIIESNLKYKGAHCFVNKRIPSKKYKRKYEIDLIVVTRKQIHFIEVKNWSGEVYQDGANWIQIKRTGERIEHPDFVHHNSFKQNVVIDYLHEHKLKIDKSFFVQKVIFMNKNLKMDSLIAENPNVVPYHKIIHYLNHQKGASLGQRFVYSVIEACLYEENSRIVLKEMFNALNSNDTSKLIRLFSDLPTWDKMGLYGEKIVNGDALTLTIGKRTIKLTQLPSGNRISFKWSRSKLGGLLKALLINDSMGYAIMNGERIPLSTKDTLLFHKAGEKEPSFIELGCVNFLLKG